MERRKDVGKEEKTSSHSRITASFKVGAVALAFLVIGYQSALFIRSAAVARLASHRDAPDTVFVIDEDLARRVLDGGVPARDASSDIPGAAEDLPGARGGAAGGGRGSGKFGIAKTGGCWYRPA